MSRLWGSLTSLRLTIFLLPVLGGLAVLGTLRFPGIYYSLWFLAPLGLLAGNLSACLVKGLPQALRRSRQRLTGELALTLPARCGFTWPPGVEPHPPVEAALRRELGRPKRLTLGHQDLYFYEQGRFRPLGPYLIHLALLLILAGGLVGKYWGLEGRLLLLTGEPAQTLASEHGEIPLGFQVILERFQVQRHQDGTPREFRSDLIFRQPGQPPLKAVCRVNDPVTVGGLTFYQASYGRVVHLQVKLGESVQALKVPVGSVAQVPGSKFRVKVLAFEEDLTMPMGEQVRRLGPAVKVAYREDEGQAHLVWVVQNYPQLAERAPGPLRFTLLDQAPQYYSVLQVKRDPGVWWVYSGFGLMLPGFFLAFCRPSRRWALVLEQNADGGWQGRLLGAAPRDREGFTAGLERLMRRLKHGEGA